MKTTREEINANIDEASKMAREATEQLKKDMPSILERDRAWMEAKPRYASLMGMLTCDADE